MKPCCFFIAMLTIACGFSQPTLNSGNFSFAVGQQENYLPYDTTGAFALIGQSANGANVTWNFQGLTPDGNNFVSLIQDGDTPPSANCADPFHIFWPYMPSQFYTLDTFSGGIDIIAEKSPANTVVCYNFPAPYITFPFTFNSFYDLSYGGSYSDGILSNVTRLGNITASGAGYGTLQLPGISFPNTLKLTYHIHNHDSSATGLAVSNQDIDWSVWVREGSAFPLLSYRRESISVNGNPPALSVSLFAVNGTLSADDYTATTPLLFPNPNNGNFTVISPSSTSSSTIRISDVSGRLMYTGLLDSPSKTISTDVLLPGIYFVEIESNGKKHTQKLVVQ